MAIADLDLAKLQQGIYQYAGDPPVAWDLLAQPQQDDGICFGIKKFPDADVIVFRGSTTTEDWARDFTTQPLTPVDHPALGPVHAGFIAGLDDAYAMASGQLGPKVIVVGHSLGAGRAILFSGLLTAAGKPPVDVVAFGEPKAGFKKLADLLDMVPIRSYRNGNGHAHDYVTDVPFTLPPLFPYQHPRPLIDVTAAPAPADSWGVFAWHHIQLYVAALESAATPLAA